MERGGYKHSQEDGAHHLNGVLGITSTAVVRNKQADRLHSRDARGDVRHRYVVHEVRTKLVSIQQERPPWFKTDRSRDRWEPGCIQNKTN